ncbi:proline dehydrogenase family protein [Roseivirga sp. BDSF3-8]|uniref:proline dehydrogenase family protein n=1 Tax=Roseivirga sp. BDSF3-8 TaxID=3241598 RepID=UPI003531A5E6
MNNASVVKVGQKMLKLAFKVGLPVRGIVRSTLFDLFCGGETIADSEATIKQLAKYEIGTILDYSVEGEKSQKGFDKTKDEIIKTIVRSEGDARIPYCVFKVSGLADSALLTRYQKNKQLSEKDKAAMDRVWQRVDEICRTAHEKKVRLFIDGEESWFQHTIDEITYEMMRRYNRERCIVYNTFQMYRHDMLGLLKEAHTDAKSEGYYLGVKLVRGAYMEKERDRAEEEGYTDPIQPTKADTDQDFDAALAYCLEHNDTVRLCSGSHNDSSNYLLMKLMNDYGMRPDDDRVWFAQLYGMSDNISFNLAKGGYNVAKYVPYGPVKAVMPYLMRRADENTSIAGQSSREFMLIRKEIKRRKGDEQGKLVTMGVEVEEQPAVSDPLRTA